MNRMHADNSHRESGVTNCRVRYLFCLLLVAAPLTVAPLTTNAQSDPDIFSIDYKSGIYSIDLNGDGENDRVVAGYNTSGTAHSFFDIAILLADHPSFSHNQSFYTVTTDLPIRQYGRYVTTARNSDCETRNIKFVKLDSDDLDYKLLVIERRNIPGGPGGGYTESEVNFRLLELSQARTAGAPLFQYKEVALIESDSSYCSVDEAYATEWADVREQLVLAYQQGQN